MKWRSFLFNDLILLIDIPSNVQNASVKHDLNKAQTKALARLEQVSPKVFQDVTQKGSIPLKDQNNHLLAKLELDPMAGGGVVADTCLAFNRRCWSFDLLDRVKTRPEIEPFLWDPENLSWPLPSGKKPDLIFFDPPYFKKMAAHYMKGSISDFSKSHYLNFFKHIFSLMREQSKPTTLMAFLNADFRDFQGIPAVDENPDNAILMFTYAKLLEPCGWKITHLMDCPLSFVSMI